MDDAEDTDDSGHWKQKYLDQLESFEHQQAQWQETEELLRKTVSRLTLAADGIDATLDGQLRALRDAIRDRVDSHSLKQHIEAMSRTLVKLDARDSRPVRDAVPEPQPQARAPAAPPAAEGGGLLGRLFRRDRQPEAADGEALTVRTVLLELLQRLPLPAELEQRAARLREQLEAGDPPGGWEAFIDAIAGLVAELRERSQAERQGLEQFLSGIVERLQTVDRHLKDSTVLNEAGRDSGAELENAVRREVGDLEADVRGASDIEQMKHSVQRHLDAVMEHVSRHREDQETRYRQAQEHIDAMNARLRTLEEETESLQVRVRDEHSQATTDALTGIPNRLAWQEHVEQEVARFKRFGTPLVFLFWDVDHFKRINDNYGHKAGDKVLRKIAGILRDGIRETDFVARFGGEEFVMLMTGSDLDASLEVAERLRGAVQQTGFHFRDQAVTITLSCGLTRFSDGDSVDQALERADRAMYQAKQQGRNRCVCG